MSLASIRVNTRVVFFILLQGQSRSNCCWRVFTIATENAFTWDADDVNRRLRARLTRPSKRGKEKENGSPLEGEGAGKGPCSRNGIRKHFVAQPTTNLQRQLIHPAQSRRFLPWNWISSTINNVLLAVPLAAIIGRNETDETNPAVLFIIHTWYILDNGIAPNVWIWTKSCEAFQPQDLTQRSSRSTK